MKHFIIFQFIVLAVFWNEINCGDNVGGQMIEVFKWKQIKFTSSREMSTDFVFPDSMPPKQPSNQQPDYIAENVIPMGVNHYKGKLFVTLPRRRPGVPSTVNIIDLNKLSSTDTSPKLTPYPNSYVNSLHANLQPDSNKIISVYRTRVDNDCNRLWFVDTGMLEYPNNRTQIQPPAIWIIDLKTGETIRRFEIPSAIATVGRGMASITVDVDRNTCNDAYAYIPDLFLYGIHVYSFKENTMWSFQHNYFNFDPLWGDLNIGGQQFQWNDGIFSITLGNILSDGCKNVYFHSMASISEFVVSNKVLKNQANSQRDWHGDDFKHLGYKGESTQSTMHAFDLKTKTILYAEIMQNGVGCWNTNKPISSHQLLLSDPNKMIYPSDISIDADGYVWLMTNALPIFIYSKLNPNEYNFRVWKQTVQQLLQNSNC